MKHHLLSNKQVENFHRDGYLVIPHYLSHQEVFGARSRISEIISSFAPSEVSVFSTTEQIQTSDAYFLESGDKIHCFFEEEAFDQKGNLISDKHMSINKVGHALHDLDDFFKLISYKSELAQICKAIGMRDPIMVQSQYIFKQPKIGGKVVAHQDSTFIYTSPPSCLGFWMALEDAAPENGCLMAIPGSHQQPLGSRRFVRNSDGRSTKFTGDPSPEWDLEKMVPLNADQGSLILLHGSLVHMSLPNRSAKSRHAYILHLVEASAMWPPDNWLQRPDNFPFNRLYELV